MNSGNAIEVNGLVKSYSGQAVLRDLSFAVPKGSICGFLGTNGAGKTTTLRILMGFARAHAGSAKVLGMTSGIDAVEINKRVGFVPEIKEAYPFARVFEMAKVTRGFYPNWDHELERRLMEEFELPSRQWCSPRGGSPGGESRWPFRREFSGQAVRPSDRGDWRAGRAPR